MWLDRKTEKLIFGNRGDEPWWLLWLQRLVYYGCVYAGLALLVLAAYWLKTTLIWD